MGKLAGGQGVAYVITDGAPSSGQEVVGKSILGQWENFLATNHINSVAAGFSSGIEAQDGPAVDALAYNGAGTPPARYQGTSFPRRHRS